MAMSNTSLFISVEDDLWKQALPEYGELSNQVVIAVIEYLTKNPSEKLPIDGSKPIIINLSLSNDELVQKLNAEFRNIDKPTNVLSFANIDDPDFYSDIEIYDEIELGDIIIALQTLQRESDLLEISLKDHFCHLFAHGLLHLFGFDHLEDQEAKLMENAEVEILSELNIENPYKE